MYYKMINTGSPLYKQLRDFRENEIKMDSDNREAIKGIVQLEFDKFKGHTGQGSFDRVTVWSGFLFNDPAKVDGNIWRKDPENPACYLPDKRRKEGREMADKLNSMPRSSFFRFEELLGIEMTGRFSFPYIFVCGDMLLFYIDSKFEPVNEDFIEITKKEFEQIRTDFPEKI